MESDPLQRLFGENDASVVLNDISGRSNFIFTVTERLRTKKRGSVSHSSGIGTERDFPPVFSRDWDGTGIFFGGGSGMGEI